MVGIPIDPPPPPPLWLDIIFNVAKGANLVERHIFYVKKIE
jgi:hypothetical protein